MGVYFSWAPPFWAPKERAGPARMTMLQLWPRIAPFALLLASNVFMTFAWYGHLKHRNVALPLAIFVSWLIAGAEYMLAVPANRIGAAAYTTAELKTIQ